MASSFLTFLVEHPLLEWMIAKIKVALVLIYCKIGASFSSPPDRIVVDKVKINRGGGDATSDNHKEYPCATTYAQVSAST